MNKEELEEVFELNPGIIKMDGYDDCIIGICERFGMETVLAYDKDKIIRRLIEDGMTHEEAIEFFYYNQIGAWMGDMTPVFITHLQQEESYN